MDGAISAALMRMAGRHPILDRAWVFCARYLIVLLGIGFLWVVWNAPASSRGTFLLTAFAAVILNETISWGIAYVHFRPRPFVENHLSPLVRIAPGMKSFPSDHAVISFTIATTLLVFLFFGVHVVAPLYVVAAFLIALLISTARVVCGVHYPSDVLVGALLGILGTLVTVAVTIVYFWTRVFSSLD